MACRSGQNPADWIQKLAQWRTECQRSILREDQIASGAPIKPEDDYVLSGGRSLPLLQNWPIASPPDWALKNDGSASRPTWRPKNVRLSDAGVVYALLALPQYYRIQFLAFDSDSNGDVRRDRVPKAPTVIAYQNGLPTLLTWKGVYILTGGYNDAGWLLADEFPNQELFFQSGLVISAPQVEKCAALSTQLTRYEPISPKGWATTAGLWEYGRWAMGIELRGCRDINAHCLVLEGSALSGYQKMGSLAGFVPLIYPGANPSDSNQAIQDIPPSSSTMNGYSLIRWSNITPRSLEIGDSKEGVEHGSCRDGGNGPTPRNPKRKREIESDNYKEVVAARHWTLLATKREPGSPAQEQLDTSSSTTSTFRTLWKELTEVETPPEHWELFMTVVSLEDLYQRWGWNAIAAKVVRNKFSSSEASILRAVTCQLPPRVAYAMFGFDMNRDAVAIEHAFSYNTTRFQFARKVDDLEEGPAKKAYQKFSSYFGGLTSSEATADNFPLNVRESGSPNKVESETEENVIRSPEIPPCHSHDNEPHCLQPGIVLCNYLESIEHHEHYYRHHKAVGLFHQQMTKCLEQLDLNRPESPPCE